MPLYTTKSFCNIDTMVSNQPGINNTFGEITPYIQTFSRDTGKYSDALYPEITLYALYNKINSGSSAVSQAIDSESTAKCLAMCNYVADYVSSSTGEIFQDILLQQLSAFAQTIGVTGVIVGDINQHGSKWGPDFIKFNYNNTQTLNQEEHQIWFSSTAIQSQYTEYEIVVIPPFQPIDNFFTPPNNVATLLSSITQQQNFDKINTATNGKPYTLAVSRNFDYYSPLNTSQTLDTNWMYLIYGPAGDNLDSIKDATVNYILSNSQHIRDDWMAILPDIFRRTEFVIVPFWHKYAVEPMTLYPQAVRSPIVTSDEIIAHALLGTAGEYLEPHVRTNATSTVFNYTSIAVAIIGNVENRDNKYKVTDFYPDYFVTPTSSIDFNRMQQSTQDWVSSINSMLAHAETMTANSSIPVGYNRLKRGNMIYISKTMGDVAYLVAVKDTVVSNLN